VKRHRLNSGNHSEGAMIEIRFFDNRPPLTVITAAEERDMKIQVLTDDGQPVFAFGNNGQGQMQSVSPDVSHDVASILLDAQAWLAHDKIVIGSINADIQACVGRIEHELGAHPALTWAQTKLGNAIAHLEQFVQGKWTEPKQALVPAGTAFDARGVLVQVDNPAPTSAPAAPAAPVTPAAPAAAPSVPAAADGASSTTPGNPATADKPAA
jgi:hypothetical protein